MKNCSKQPANQESKQHAKSTLKEYPLKNTLSVSRPKSVFSLEVVCALLLQITSLIFDGNNGGCRSRYSFRMAEYGSGRRKRHAADSA